MANSSLIKRLQERGLVTQVTDEEVLTERLAQDPIVLYYGLDPTTDSLHLRHLVPLLYPKRFQQADRKPVALVDGATGLINDPSPKVTERKLDTEGTVQEWMDKIRKQMAPFLDSDYGDNSVTAVNNYDWFSSMNVLTLLHDIGKHFSVSQMISKEAVKQRLNRDDRGIPLTEFFYNLLQGYGSTCLDKLYGVASQIGGSDQRGNITSGIDLTRRLYQNQVFGPTVLLITKADSTKLGKTEGGAIRLGPRKTSPYKLYRLQISTVGANVYRFLGLFAFMDMAEIGALEEEDKNSDKAPCIQYVLAEQVACPAHGEESLGVAKRITGSLFNGNLSDLGETDFERPARDDVSTAEVEKSVDFPQALVDSELQSSRGRTRKTVVSNAMTINDEKQADPEYISNGSDRLFGRYTSLRRSKENYCLVRRK